MEGIGFNIVVDYGCDGTGADYEDDGLKYLKDLGFKVDKPTGYDAAYIKSSLDNGRIVTANGKSEKTNWILFNTYGGGHAWVIDGYAIQEKEVLVEIVNYDYYLSRDERVITGHSSYIVKEQRTLFGMNWGWNGDRNGYFTLGSFDADSPVLLKSDTDLNFQHKKKVAAVYR